MSKKDKVATKKVQICCTTIKEYVDYCYGDDIVDDKVSDEDSTDPIWQAFAIKELYEDMPPLAEASEYDSDGEIIRSHASERRF